MNQIKVFSAQTDILSSLLYSFCPLPLNPQCRLNRGNCVLLAAQHVVLVHSTGRTGPAACLCAACRHQFDLDLTISLHLAQSRGQQRFNSSDARLKRICGIYKSGFSRGAPQVMTGLH